MATIRTHRGKWQAIVRRKGYSQQSKSFTAKAHAVQWARQTESDLDTGQFHRDTKILDATTVGDLLIRYRDTVTIYKRGRASEATRLNSFLRQSWAQLTLSKATSGVFSCYRDRRLSMVQPASVRRDLGLLRSVFQVAMNEWDLPLIGNPLINIARPKEPEARCRRLEGGEKDLLLRASEGHTAPWLKFGIMLALETGMRRGELLSARWKDVDFQQSTLRIQASKNGYGRTIPLSKAATDTLNLMLSQESQDSEFILNVNANAFQKAWQRCKKRVACDHPDILTLRFHDLRHEAITHFFEIGLSVPEVALISGHRDPRIPFKYTHLRAEDIVEKISSGC